MPAWKMATQAEGAIKGAGERVLPGNGCNGGPREPGRGKRKM